MPITHRHLSNIDCLIACNACLVSVFSTVNGRNKKRKNALDDVALVVGTQQNLSNLYSLDIYAVIGALVDVDFFATIIPTFLIYLWLNSVRE